MKALLFFDIDGTLLTLDEQHRMPESTIEALHQAKQRGHEIFINTGRVRTAIDKHLLEFGFDGLVCGCGTYIEYHGRPLLHNRLTKEQCLAYAQDLRKLHYQTVFEGKDRLFIEGEYGPDSFMEYIYTYFSENSDYPIEESAHPEFIFDKLTTVQMEDSDPHAFTIIPHFGKVFELVPKGFSKATGIQLLMDYLHVQADDCYAFGDSINDLEMLRFVQHSVGMGNSVKEVLEVVEFRTTDILEDGITNALKHYGLIE